MFNYRKISTSKKYLVLFEGRSVNDIIRFPKEYKDVVTQGVKNITYRIGEELGKYKKGRIYRVFSYDGEDWKTKIKIIEVITGKYRDFKKERQGPRTIDTKQPNVSPNEPMEKIRFTIYR